MVLLTRHTRPAVAADLCYGRLDVPLEASAAAEIEAVCVRLTSVKLVLTSPAQRCVGLAGEIAARFGATLELEPALQELDFGDWEGRSWTHIGRAAIDEWARDVWRYRPGNGESLAELWQRVENLVQRRDLHRVSSARNTTVIVTHHGPLRALHCIGAGWESSRFFESRFDFGAQGLRAWPSQPWIDYILGFTPSGPLEQAPKHPAARQSGF